MIVWLSSYPRSGNTLLRTAIHHVHGVNTRDLYFPEADPSWSGEMLKAADHVGFETISSMDQLADSDELAFIKTHELPGDDYPAIYVVRDGRDALISYAHFILTTERGYKSGDTSDAYQSEFLSTLVDLVTLNQSYGGWSQHVLSWTCRHGLTAVIRFEDLLVDPVRTLEGAIKRLSLDKYLPQRAESFSSEASRLSSPTHFRKGKVGSFEQEMPLDIERAFWSHHGEVMKLMGYRNTFAESYVARFLKSWKGGNSRAA